MGLAAALKSTAIVPHSLNQEQEKLFHNAKGFFLGVFINSILLYLSHFSLNPIDAGPYLRKP